MNWVIPEDWDVKSVGEFTDCSAGGTPSNSSTRLLGEIILDEFRRVTSKRVYDVAERISDLGLANSSTKRMAL